MYLPISISLLTDNVRTVVINLSDGWLPVGVRESRCGATADICLTSRIGILAMSRAWPTCSGRALSPTKIFRGGM
jgi:hypothetical protein